MLQWKSLRLSVSHLYNRSCVRYFSKNLSYSKTLCFSTATNFLPLFYVGLSNHLSAAVLAHTISQSVSWRPVLEVSWPMGQNLAETVSGGVAVQSQDVKEDTFTTDGRVEPRKEPKWQRGNGEARQNVWGVYASGGIYRSNSKQQSPFKNQGTLSIKNKYWRWCLQEGCWRV